MGGYLRDRARRAALLTAMIVVGSATHAVVEQPSERQSRVRAARLELARALERGEVEGRFVERLSDSVMFTPTDITLPHAPVANSAEVPAPAVGPLLQVRGSIDDRGFLTVKSYRLKRLGGRGPATDKPSDVSRAADGLFQALETAVASRPVVPGGGRESRVLESGSGTDVQARQTIASILKAYRTALENNAGDAALAAIARQWADVRALMADVFPESEFKALYGALDNYPPWTYDVIFRQSSSVVAIGEPGKTTSICSGVLIASDLVLTAAHCFAAPQVRPPNTLEVWFDYADQPGGAPRPPLQRRPILRLVAPAPERLTELLAGDFSADLLDYAIVQMAPPTSGPVVPAGAAPQCLRKNALHKGDAVYVVGYPRGAPVMVHDSARVYLPYRVMDGAQFARLRMDVDADMLSVEGREEFMRQFDLSYELETDDAGLKWRVLRNVRDAGQPRMGIVADTFQGNSGGPVYDRAGDQCVVGILVAGATDTGTRRTPNWKEHERVLPASAIIDDISKTPSTTALTGQLTVR